MSNQIQNINEITPLQKDGKTDSADPVQAEYLEGKGLLERNETGMAAVALHNALIGYEERGDDNGIANASNQLGNVCLQRKEFDKAIGHFKRAEEICEKLGDPISLLALSKQMIVAYTEAGQYKEAASRCLHILELYQANNNPKGTVETLEDMAEIYIKAGDNGKASDAYRTIASIHKNFKHEKMAKDFLKKAEELDQADKR